MKVARTVLKERCPLVTRASTLTLHLELANQRPPVGEQNTDSNNIGDSWNAAGWDEIFDSLDEEEEEE